METTKVAQASVGQPKIFIDPMVRKKIMHWVLKAGDKECSGLGGVIVQNGALHVVEAFMTEQKNTSGDTELDAASIAKALYDHREKPWKIRFWWHSHHKMGVFWSKTDVDAIRQLGKEDWFLSTVFNAKGETKSCIYGNLPFEFCYDNLTLQDTRKSIPEDLLLQWDSEYDSKVLKPILSQYSYPWAASGSTWNGHEWVDDGKGSYKRVGGLSQVGEHLGLSKKAQKRLARFKKSQQKRMTGTGEITMEDQRELLEEVELPCIICELRYQCVCPAKELVDAYALEEAGTCWCCYAEHKWCVCGVSDTRKAIAEEIADRAIVAGRHQAQPKGPPPALPDGSTQGVG